jgi:hypothetical protein
MECCRFFLSARVFRSHPPSSPHGPTARKHCASRPACFTRSVRAVCLSCRADFVGESLGASWARCILALPTAKVASALEGFVPDCTSTRLMVCWQKVPAGTRTAAQSEQTSTRLAAAQLQVGSCAAASEGRIRQLTCDRAPIPRELSCGQAHFFVRPGTIAASIVGRSGAPTPGGCALVEGFSAAQVALAQLPARKRCCAKRLETSVEETTHQLAAAQDFARVALEMGV